MRSGPDHDLAVACLWSARRLRCSAAPSNSPPQVDAVPSPNLWVRAVQVSDLPGWDAVILIQLFGMSRWAADTDLGVG
jgi:hypothetical protein